jgi:hypothetical protein
MKGEMQSSTEIHETKDAAAEQRRSWRESDAFKTAEALRPWIQWALIGVLGIFTIYMSFRETNANQVVTIQDLEKRTTRIETSIVEKGAARDRQINDLKAAMVTNELFNERTDNITEQLKEIKNDQKEILNRLPVRLP